MSPLEHPARPMTADELDLTAAWDVAFSEDGPALRVRLPSAPYIGQEVTLESGRKVTVARVRGPLNYCGKLNGWCSLRSTIAGEWDVLGERR